MHTIDCIYNNIRLVQCALYVSLTIVNISSYFFDSKTVFQATFSPKKEIDMTFTSLRLFYSSFALVYAEDVVNCQLKQYSTIRRL